MLAQTTQNSLASLDAGETETSITPLAQPNIQLVMTYKESSSAVEIDAHLAEWLDAKCADLGVCALSVLVACAEMCHELE